MKIEQTYEVVRIDGDHDPLREHPQNPNHSDDEVIGESIDVNGWYGAIIAQKSTGYILAGHGRYRSAKARKAREIPVLWKDVDDETALKILLVDNESARQAEMDEEQLYLILSNLDSLEGTGYKDVLTPLERELSGDDDEDQGRSEDPRDEASAGSDQEPGVPGADDVPDDQHTPEWGVMLVCESEPDAKMLFEGVKSMIAGSTPDEAMADAWDLLVAKKVKIRVVAT